MPMSIYIYTHRNMYIKIVHNSYRLRNNAKRTKIQNIMYGGNRILKTNQKHRYNIIRLNDRKSEDLIIHILNN